MLIFVFGKTGQSACAVETVVANLGDRLTEHQWQHVEGSGNGSLTVLHQN